MYSKENDTFLVLTQSSEARLSDRGSRFIARAFPVESVEHSRTVIEELRRQEHDATHHCSAYRIGENAEFVRSNDDGEPSGTAGVPILRQIESVELTNTLVVVTRYYGGTKLGTGGLIRAYGGCAESVLKGASLKRIVRRTSFHLVFDYADTSPAMHTIQQYDAVIASTVYGEQTQMVVLVRRSECTVFKSSFINALGGRGSVESTG